MYVFASMFFNIVMQVSVSTACTSVLIDSSEGDVKLAAVQAPVTANVDANVTAEATLRVEPMDTASANVVLPGVVVIIVKFLTTKVPEV